MNDYIKQMPYAMCEAIIASQLVALKLSVAEFGGGIPDHEDAEVLTRGIIFLSHLLNSAGLFRLEDAIEYIHLKHNDVNGAKMQLYENMMNVSFGVIDEEIKKAKAGDLLCQDALKRTVQ